MLKVLEVPLTFVEYDDGVLSATAPSILEGFPLANAAPVFESAAIARSVDPRHEGWNGLQWLCLFNERDPDQTAIMLRETSKVMRERLPEEGIRKDLPWLAASLLLLLTGQEEDEIAAADLNHTFGRSLTYGQGHLATPAQGLFPLERRYAELILSDKSIPVLSRAERCRELWLDPTFKPPESFLAEIEAAANKVDVQELDRHSATSIEDHHFELIEPVLARYLPNLLVDVMRSKMRSIATSPPASRYWSAIHVTNSLILLEDDSVRAAHALRVGSRESDNGNELFSSYHLLALELQDREAHNQAELIIDAGLKFIPVDLGHIMRPLTNDDVDALIARFGSGTAAQQRDLLTLLGLCRITLSEVAWAWVMKIALDTTSESECQRLAYLALMKADPNRFGRELLTCNWSWSKEKEFLLNHCGSGALIEATTGKSFDQVAPLLAPWRLLEAVRRRGRDPVEVTFAAMLFGRAIATELESPDPGSDVSADRDEEHSGSFTLSITPLKPADDNADPFATFKASLDLDARIGTHRRALETAGQRIDEARRLGASLYLTDIDPQDFDPVFRVIPEMIHKWIEGIV